MLLRKMANGLTNDYMEKTGLKLYKNHTFLGVFPCNKPPTIDQRKKFSLIFNTGHSSTKGEHFVAIYCNRSQFYYFDSLGSPDIDINISNFIQSTINKRSLILYIEPIQHPLSTFCGFYCLAFLISKDLSLEDGVFYNHFNEKASYKNDKKVVYFITTNLI